MISMILTAFVLVTVSSVVTRAAGASEGVNNPIPVFDGQVDAGISQNNTALQAAPQSSAGVSSGAGVTVEEALRIAEQAAYSGDIWTGGMDLVNYEGATAYEVTFGQGNMYINAASGEVLFNGTLIYEAPNVSAQEAAAIAAEYMGRTDVSNVTDSSYNGQFAYKVEFDSGDTVYVSLKGELLLVNLMTGGYSDDEDDDNDDDNDDDDDDDNDDDNDDNDD